MRDQRLELLYAKGILLRLAKRKIDELTGRPDDEVSELNSPPPEGLVYDDGSRARRAVD